MVSELSMRVSATPELLTIEWPEGGRSEYPSVWLRDNRPEDRDGHSGQRLVDVADLPEAPRIAAVHATGGEVEVRWQDATPATRYAAAWLRRQSTPPADERPEQRPRLWLDGAMMDGRRDFAWATLDGLRTEASLRCRWLTRLLEDGIGFLSDVPCTEGAILDAANLIGRVAETNYGRLFDVRSVARPENLAYSDFGLGLHTDNPYRDPVPGFQALHALVASPDGGENLFADGFALADHLRATEPATFELLSRTQVPFLYRSANAELYSEKPLIQLDVAGRLRAVHYNSRSVAPVRLGTADMAPFYAAYRRFAQLLREPRFQVRMKLGDGDLVVFDNRRTLHGRTAFVSARHPRHLQGCYLTRDSVLSRAAMLRRSER